MVYTGTIVTQTSALQLGLAMPLFSDKYVCEQSLVVLGSALALILTSPLAVLFTYLLMASAPLPPLWLHRDHSHAVDGCDAVRQHPLRP